ncbi:MAG: alpha-L-fucosidase [Rikenellaceae bacterium]
MKRNITALIGSLTALIGSVICCTAQPQFTATPKSLQQYEVPEWYEDAKIGYWVHWGLYSVPAYAGDHAAEWYGRWMYAKDDGTESNYNKSQTRGLKTAQHHRETYGDPSEFSYRDFIPMWRAERFDAEAWADLFQEGGAKFFTMMAMHHDNYPLWNSETTPINSARTGPKRDFVAEMERAVRKRGLKFGVSNHSAWNSRFFEFYHKNGFNDEKSSLYGHKSNPTADNSEWWARSTELVERYHPDLVWYDWCWNSGPFDMQTRMNFCSWYYNRAADWGLASKSSPEVVVAYKAIGKLPDGSAVLDLERGAMAQIYPYVWMTDTSLGLRSWSYAPDEEYRSPNQVVDMLVDIVSKNGVLLLNIGPKADGTIPEVAQRTIKMTGEWLAMNGEGIYATRPWTIYGEGPTQPGDKMDGDHVEYTNRDIRFTRSKDQRTLYIHALGYDKSFNVEILRSGNIDLSSVKRVTLLGCGEVRYRQNEQGFELRMPKGANKQASAYTFKVEFDGEIPQLTNHQLTKISHK